MAHLEVCDNGEIKRHSLFKRMTSIGKDYAKDIVVSEESENISCYIAQNGNQFNLVVLKESSPVYVDGVPIKNHLLKDGNCLKLGSINAIFRLDDKPILSSEDRHQSQILAYRRLLDFSVRIAQEKNIETLLKTLLKGITDLTGAEHGFLVLIEDGKLVIKVRESKNSKDDFSAIDTMSDSIVKKVIEKKQSIIVNDALHDREFASSLSVINYRLSSVMCVPLLYQGYIFGAIYVGNNSLVNAFDKEKLELMTIYTSQAALLVQNALHINALKKRTKNLTESLELAKFGSLIGSCQGMQQVFLEVERVSDTNISVLICGEAGTGKELIARELHNRSQRKDGPFIIFNCSSIPENLLESELFGHVRGAFEGATYSRTGKFQSAHNGTLFLDEINELPLHMQVKLLVALKDCTVARMGENKLESVNIRVISATNCDLLELTMKNQFREDLYYRLSEVQIGVPALKDRGNDVLVIANFFLQKYTKIYGKNIIGLDEEAQNALINYHWPGNVRQLENRMQRAVVMCDHPRIGVKDLDILVSSSTKIMPLQEALDRFRAGYIDQSLERNAFNRTKTAQELGVDPRTIFRHLESKRKFDNEVQA